MAFLQCEFQSTSLRMPTRVYAILPHDILQGSEPRETLYLLHGKGQAALSWVRYTSMERYAEKYKISVIIPEGSRSFYTDMQFGADYFTYITKELPSICAKMFRIENDPLKTYIFGLSMGGYGALKCALTYPESYAGCGAFSALTDIHYRIDHTRRDTPQYRELKGIFGTELVPDGSQDLYNLAEKVAVRHQRPDLFITCGSEDSLYPLNKSFCSYLNRLGYAHTFIEWHGRHEWEFWDVSLEKAMEYFFNRI